MGYYKKISQKIECLLIDKPGTEQSLSWINIIDAGRKEIDYLRKEYNITYFPALLAQGALIGKV